MPLTWRNETFYTVPEAAVIFGVTQTVLYADLRSGKLPFALIRGQRYIRESDIDQIFGTTSQAPPPQRTTAEQKRAAEAAMKRLKARGY